MLAGSKPIEVLVTGFCIVTLAYFQLLHSVKHSEFLQPSSTSYSSLLRPSQDGGAAEMKVDDLQSTYDASIAATTLVRNTDGQWTQVASNAPELADPAINTLILSRIIVGLDSQIGLMNEDDRNILVYPAHSSAPVIGNDEHDVNHSHRGSRQSRSSSSTSTSAATSTLEDPEVQASLKQFEHHIKVANYAGHSFQEICYRVSNGNEDSECFSLASPPSASSQSSAATVLSLGLDAATGSEAAAFQWQQALASSSPLTDAKGYTYMPVAASTSRRTGQDGLGLSFSAFPPTDQLSSSSSNSQYNAEESKSVKWMLYAGRAFIMRFYALAKVS